MYIKGVFILTCCFQSIRMSAFRFSIFALAIFMSSCSGRLEKHGELFAEFMKNDDGVFRGVNIGDKMNQVENAEGTAPNDESNNNLSSYEGSIGESGTYVVRYGFENGKVYEILVESSFDENKEGLKMISGFRDFFNEKYGAFEKEAGYLVWKTKSAEHSPNCVIEMVDESEFADFGQFSLSIYREPNTPQKDSLIQ
jgi:hypothetical protein